MRIPFTRGHRVVGASTKARGTFTDDIERATSAEATPPDLEIGAAADALTLKALTTVRAATHRRARRLLRACHSFSRAVAWEANRRARLQQATQHPRHITRLRVALDHDVRSARIGFLTSWISHTLVLLLIAAMLINDPLMLHSIARRAFDAPVDGSILDFSEVGNIIAAAAAIGVSSILVAVTKTGGRALATVVFTRDLLKHPRNYPEATRTRRELSVISICVILATCVIVLIATLVVLWTMAGARMGGVSASLLTGGPAVANALKFYITALPVGILLFEFVASAPQFEHARQASTWSRQFRRREQREIRAAQVVQRILTTRKNHIDRVKVAMDETISAVELRANSEIVDAALNTKAVTPPRAAAKYSLEPSSPENKTPRAHTPAPASSPEPAQSAELLTEQFPVGSSGSLWTGLRAATVISPTVAASLNSWHSLPQTPTADAVRAGWVKLREDASTIPDDERTDPAAVETAGQP